MDVIQGKKIAVRKNPFILSFLSFNKLETNKAKNNIIGTCTNKYKKVLKKAFLKVASFNMR